MQITFNTEDNIDDLTRIYEILSEAIKKKNATLNSVNNINIIQQPQVSQKTMSFSDLLKHDTVASINKMSSGFSQNPQLQTSNKGKTEIEMVNEEYKKQYEENKNNPNKPKSQNPELDISNIYYSEKRRKS